MSDDLDDAVEEQRIRDAESGRDMDADYEGPEEELDRKT